MTRDQLDFIAIAVIGMMVLYALKQFLDWLDDDSGKSIKPSKQLMKELQRHSWKDDDPWAK
jgi:hypothetical protein